MQTQKPKQPLLRRLASMKLSVVLLAMSLVLVFAGTLAQTDHGIWYITDKYFRSLWVWIDLGVFIPGQEGDLGIGFPFLGGYAIGGLLFINMLAALLTTIRFKSKNFGMILTHAGLMVLISGEFVTGMAADEGNMTIDEGSSSNYVEDSREVELAFTQAIDGTSERVVVVPESILESSDETLTHPLLPFEVRIREWMPNSQVHRDSPPPDGIAEEEIRGLAMFVAASPIDTITGVGEQRVNVPSTYITILKDGKELGTWLFSVYIDREQDVEIPDGEDIGIALRFKRTYKPYTLHLIDFSHDRFVGTDRPRNFSSRVRLVNPNSNEDREVLIYMNHPLRHAGDTLYQSSYKPDETGTILQVVRNPGWLIPYVSCILVSIGLGIHFFVRLVDATRRVSR